jgi:hypothetical protein
VKINLARYSNTYFLIGTLELLLRERVISTLSRYSKEKNYAEWSSVLPTKELRKSALKEIQFGFYRQVLSQKYFTELWVPATHLMFSGLANPRTLKSCQMVENRMHYASQTRNRVCHFTFDNFHNVEHEEANLRWLIRALGEKSVAIVETNA